MSAEVTQTRPRASSRNACSARRAEYHGCRQPHSPVLPTNTCRGLFALIIGPALRTNRLVASCPHLYVLGHAHRPGRSAPASALPAPTYSLRSTPRRRVGRSCRSRLMDAARRVPLLAWRRPGPASRSDHNGPGTGAQRRASRASVQLVPGAPASLNRAPQQPPPM